MAESPKSELHSKFSTPVSELDDHRKPPASIPRAEAMLVASSSADRRETVPSITFERPQLRPDHEMDFLTGGTVAKDFEHAIVDDDRSARSPVAPRRGSMARRRADTTTDDNVAVKSSASSQTSRSSSPPNSVDAFAAPRRGRAGTVTSRAPSDPEIHRTESGHTHRRRPTFSEGPKSAAPNDSDRGTAESDICFPVEDEAPATAIDFEELEELAVLSRERNMLQNPVVQPQTTFNDLRPETDGRRKSSASSLRNNVDEKHADLMSTMGPPQRETENDVKPRWSFFSSEVEDTIHASNLGDLLMDGETFRDLFDFGEKDGVWWLDMLNLCEEDVTAVCKAFNVHPLTREDIVQQESREKVELFNSYYFMCFRSAFQEEKHSESYLEAINVYAVVFREGLLTFTFSPSPHANNVRARMSKLRDHLSVGADWICYALIDDIVDSFAPAIRDVEVETDGIEESVFTARFEDSYPTLRRIGEARKRVMQLLRLLGGKADVIKGFAKRCNDQYSVAPRQDVGLYLSDIQDHVVTMLSNLGHCEKMLGRAHANYLAQINVENIVQGNVANKTLGKITLLATIMVPLNLVTGLFGMNVEVPGKNPTTLSWWFGILGCFIVYALICVGIAKKYKYI